MGITKKLNRKTEAAGKYQTVKTVLVAIPVFNELGYVDNVLNAIRAYSDSILVVDDGSTDGTSELLKQHNDVEILSHKTNIGYGQCLMDAFDFACRKKFDWVITIDCDYQHEPSYIPHFYSAIKEDDADIVSGSRYLRRTDWGSVSPPPERVAINKRITGILNENLDVELTDAFCGFKAYRTTAISRIKLTEKGYRLPLQLWIRAVREGLRICEIPVPLIYHDPERNFCGALENPAERLKYYLEIIEKEL